MRKIDRIRNHLERVHHDDHRLYQSEYDDYKLIIELAELILQSAEEYDDKYATVTLAFGDIGINRFIEILNQLEADE